MDARVLPRQKKICMENNELGSRMSESVNVCVADG